MINAAFGSFLVTYQRNTCKTKGRKGRRIKIGVDKFKGMMSCVSFVPHFKPLELQNAVKEDREVLNRIKCNTNGKMLLPGNGKRANSQLFGLFSTPRDCLPPLHKAAHTEGTPPAPKSHQVWASQELLLVFPLEFPSASAAAG